MTTLAPVINPGPAGSKTGRSDPGLALATLGLALFGALVVYSATRGTVGDRSFVGRQVAFLIVGGVMMVVVSRVDHRRLRRGAPFVLALTVLVLVAVLSPLGTEVRGTKGWFQLLGLSLQPAEFAKVSLVIGLAALLTSSRRIEERGRFAVTRFLAGLAVVATIAGLVLAGGETGSVLIYLATALALFALGGVPARFLALLTVSAILGVSLVLSSGLLAPYQRDRLVAFVDTEADPLGAGYNQRQSVTAIGSGGLAGKGLFNGPQTQLRYLPEQQTDFIFAVVSEELGFVGAVAVVLVEGFILFRILAISRLAADPFGALLCVGVFGFLAVQVFQNVGMNLRLLPVAGIPLPFVSYGGSSLVAGLLAVGVVQSVARGRSDDRAAGLFEPSGQALYSLADPGGRRASRRSTPCAR